MKYSSILAIFFVFLVSQFSSGDIVSHTLSGLVVAELENVTTLSDSLSGDVDASTLILNGTAATENSITTSLLDYNWDGTTLTGTGFIDEEKTIAAKKGGLHKGESTLTFQFTIDQTSTYALAGTYGFVGITAADELDKVSWSISGTSYFAEGIANNVSDLTVHDQLFSTSDTITAGTYTLTLLADFHEPVNNPTSREAGWEITSFTVSNAIAVPEPGSFIVLAAISLGALRRRTRK